MAHNFTLRVAEFFKANPLRWIDARELEAIGGRQAWRTRLSEARRFYQMNIENRVERHPGFTRSLYRYVPPAPVEPTEREQLDFFCESVD